MSKKTTNAAPTIKAVVFMFLLVARVLPCAALSLQGAVTASLDELSGGFLAGKEAYSSTGIGILPIAEESPLARRYKVGASAQSLLEKALGRSLVFKLVDRATLDKSLGAVELALSDPTGSTKVPERIIEDIEYFISGSVTEEGEFFRIALKLIKTDTTETVSQSAILLPVSDIAAYGEAIFKPFGFVGPNAAIEWDIESVRGGTYGPLAYSAGISALFPLRTLYLKAGVDGLFASGPQGASALGSAFGLPAGASGTNKFAAVYGSIGLGVFVPIVYRVYGHLDMDVGLGLLRRQVLRLFESGTSSSLVETDYDKIEPMINFGLNAGAAIKLTDFIALDLQLCVFSRWFGFMAGLEGHLFIPARIALVIPF
jgi:hypothetical protein